MILPLLVLLLYFTVDTQAASALSYVPGIIAALASGVAMVLGAVNKIQLEGVKRVADATHTLSNSAMGQQLVTNLATMEALSVVLHRIAAGQGGVEADVEAAKAIDVRVAAAKKEYTEHLIKQAVVDATNDKTKG